MEEKIKGLVANIQDYSVNDGPGTRTTVFLQGCPLRCRWCHNVEMTSVRNEVWYSSALCTCCGKCIEVCPESALKGYKDEREIDRNVCTGEACLKCVAVCPTNAMKVVARWMSTEEVLKEIQKGEIFYWRDGGGVTVSGGEPLVQHRFVTELLRQCQQHSIHSCLETCAYASWDVLSEAIKYVDIVLLDIKHMNPAKHKLGTGVPNELILENARKLAKVAQLRIRVPVIPGFNASEEELRDIAEFVKSNGVKEVDLLPYHSYADGKYKMYLRKYEFAQTQAPSENQMQNYKAIFEGYGLQVTIGG
jgi:pyruvate formate lyase activating enzyme